jgi:hypothetical protein
MEVNAITYKDLIKELNNKFISFDKPIISDNYPFIDHLYLDKTNKKLYKWNGLTHETIDLIVSESDPSIPELGTYWLSNNILYTYESSGWQIVNTLNYSTNPLDLSCGTVWFNGVDVYQWDGNHWCKLCVYISTRNPVLPPILSCNTFWYDDSENLFFKWDEKIKKWNEKLVLVSDQDPNTITTGDFWFNETDEKMYQFIGLQWNEVNRIVYLERDIDNSNIPSEEIPDDTIFWYIPDENILFRRDNEDLEWVVQPFSSYPTDPIDRKSCDLWWDTSQNPDVLYIWDIVNERWVEPDTFFKTSVDPSLATELPDCAIWYNPLDKKLKIIKDSSCADVDYIQFDGDPDNLSVGVVWFDGSNYFVYNGSSWETISPINSLDDPYELDVGEYWYDSDDEILYQWNGVGWTLLNPSLIPLTPDVNTKWYDLINQKLFKWNGSIWVEIYPAFYVELLDPTKDLQRSRIRLSTREVGCQYGINFVQENGDVLSNLAHRVIYYEPVDGSSGLVGGPSYLQLGVGDDGSPDERRNLHSKIRNALGAGSVRVELKKEEIDYCIDNALLEMRKYSGASVRRGYFFLDLKKNQQTYLMTNKCVGFHKIVDIMNIHRMKPGWMKISSAGQDLFAYAALQQLYMLGTFDILTYHLVAAYIEELETLFANKIMFSWYEHTRELKLQQIIPANERILVDATFERTEQDLMTDRQTALWVQRWAIAEAKQILSQVRGKFQTLPGPNGSTTLNAQELITQAESEKQELRALLNDWSMQNLHEYGAGPMLVIG